MLAHTSLAAIWMAYGGRWTPWLALALVVAIVCWLQFLSVVDRGFSRENSTTTAILFLLQATAIVAALGAARMAGVRLVVVGRSVLPDESLVWRPRLQFSLGYLMSWVTAVAVALGSMSYVLEYRYILPSFRDQWAPLAALSLGDAAIALGALWMVLGARTPALRTIVLCLAALATLAVWYLAIGLGEDWIGVSILLVQILWLLASLAVVRVAGYRLVWRAAGGGGQ